MAGLPDERVTSRLMFLTKLFRFSISGNKGKKDEDPSKKGEEGRRGVEDGRKEGRKGEEEEKKEGRQRSR